MNIGFNSFYFVKWTHGEDITTCIKSHVFLASILPIISDTSYLLFSPAPQTFQLLQRAQVVHLIMTCLKNVDCLLPMQPTSSLFKLNSLKTLSLRFLSVHGVLILLYNHICTADCAGFTSIYQYWLNCNS